MADVGAEPALALHPGLHRFGHLVERPRNRVEVTVSGFVDPGTEVTAGDPLGAPVQASQGPQQPADGVTADQDTDQSGGHGLSSEHPGADRHGLVKVLQGEHFDIHGVGQLHGDDEVRLATDLRPLLRPAFGGREVQQAFGESVRRHGDAGGIPGAGYLHQSLGLTHRGDLLERFGRSRAGRERRVHGPGIEESPGQCGVLALIEQVVGSESVRGNRDGSGDDDGEHPEGDRNSGP